MSDTTAGCHGAAELVAQLDRAVALPYAPGPDGRDREEARHLSYHH